MSMDLLKEDYSSDGVLQMLPFLRNCGSLYLSDALVEPDEEVGSSYRAASTSYI